MEKSLDSLLEKLLKQFSADVGMIHSLGSDDILNMIAHTKNIPPPIVEATSHIPVGKGIAGTTAMKKKPTIIKNLSGEVPKFVMPKATNIGLGGCICVPVFEDKKLIGTLSLGCFTEREFTEQETKDLMNIVNEKDVVNLFTTENQKI